MVRTICTLALLAGTGASIACNSSKPKRQPAAQTAGPFAGEPKWLTGGGLQLKAEIYKSPKVGDHPVLIVVLHGDLLDGSESPSYHYLFASRSAAKMDNVVIAAFLRPGYTDGDGDRSGGERGMATGDNYTAEVVDATAQAIGELKTLFHPVMTVLVGHSGGAAISADLLGGQPLAGDAALLVSCPCDVPEWRKEMLRTQLSNIGPLSLLFLLPVKSLSPMDSVNSVRPSVRVRMVVGSRDSVAPPKFTERYADALRKHGVDVSVTIAPGLEHNILLQPVVFEQLKDIVDAFPKATP